MKSRTKLSSILLSAVGAGALLLSRAAFAAPSVEDSEVNSAKGQIRSQLIHTSATIMGIDTGDRQRSAGSADSACPRWSQNSSSDGNVLSASSSACSPACPKGVCPVS